MQLILCQSRLCDWYTEGTPVRERKREREIERVSKRKEERAVKTFYCSLQSNTFFMLFVRYTLPLKRSLNGIFVMSFITSKGGKDEGWFLVCEVLCESCTWVKKEKALESGRWRERERERKREREKLKKGSIEVKGNSEKKKQAKPDWGWKRRVRTVRTGYLVKLCTHTRGTGTRIEGREKKKLLMVSSSVTHTHLIPFSPCFLCASCVLPPLVLSLLLSSTLLTQMK